MKNLSHRDFLALTSAIGEIYAARDIESFYAAIFSSIRNMIPYEHCSFNDINLPSTRFSKVTSSSQDRNYVIQKLLPVLNEYLHEHPLIPLLTSNQTIKTTDFVSKKKFKTLAIYNEYYRHLEAEAQIGFSIPISPEKMSVVALSKRANDFSERDRLLLTILKPHIISGLRNVTELGRVTLERNLLQKAAETEQRGTILLQSDGMISCSSALAQEICGKYFHADLAEGDALPGTLMQWFNSERNSFSKMRGTTKFPMQVERNPYPLAKEGKTLKLKLFSDLITGEYIIFMAESDPSRVLHHMRGYGLSNREVEVLQWITKGKTNSEIAAILSMSKRTVDKHLENIFAKLGVETRAAAATIMRKESESF